MNLKLRLAVSGMVTGCVNGLFGGGGGMALVPLLQGWCQVEEKRAFSNCVAVIFLFCLLSAGIYLLRTDLDLLATLPYLLGGLAGGLVGGRLFPGIPTLWLRRIFGLFLLYGGVRYLL
ncbi:MAG: sulfite exporter TauE/SafE family protein [Ruminococcaceae bacterium]|nr:sulfite exporter TauE/SafE family protein [Oscillospiraceae bacterium]